MITIRILSLVVVATFYCLPARATESAPASVTPAAASAQAVKPADAATTGAKAKDDPADRVPKGYKVKVIDGETRFCRKSTPIGTRFPTQVCMTEAQYLDAMRNQDSVRQELTVKQKSISIDY